MVVYTINLPVIAISSKFQSRFNFNFPKSPFYTMIGNTESVPLKKGVFRLVFRMHDAGCRMQDEFFICSIFCARRDLNLILSWRSGGGTDFVSEQPQPLSGG